MQNLHRVGLLYTGLLRDGVASSYRSWAWRRCWCMLMTSE